MRRFILVLSAALTVFSGCCAQRRLETNGRTESDLRSWDFSRVKSGQVLKHDFVFKNNSAKAINISGSDTSCSCAISEIEKNRLGPGESAKIRVTFKTEGYQGQTEQFVYVNSDDPAEPIVRFTVKARVE